MNKSEVEQLRRAASALDVEVSAWVGRLTQLTKEMRASMSRIRKTLAALGAPAGKGGTRPGRKAQGDADRPARSETPAGRKGGRARIPDKVAGSFSPP